MVDSLKLLAPWIYAAAAARLWRVRRDLAQLGFAPSVERWLRAITPHAALHEHEPQRLARFMHRLGRYLRGSRCLDQSLALTSVLRQRGYRADLIIGAERKPTGFNAHAWVEIDGQALDESGEPRARLSVLETWPKA